MADADPSCSCDLSKGSSQGVLTVEKALKAVQNPKTAIHIKWVREGSARSLRVNEKRPVANNASRFFAFVSFSSASRTLPLQATSDNIEMTFEHGRLQLLSCSAPENREWGCA